MTELYDETRLAWAAVELCEDATMKILKTVVSDPTGLETAINEGDVAANTAKVLLEAMQRQERQHIVVYVYPGSIPPEDGQAFMTKVKINIIRGVNLIHYLAR